jgi:GcrA cell cycle regulator
MDWTGEAIDQLRALWAEGHSTAEIGRRMGISKNAVVGKAHRLNLPARPSPIRREPGAQRPPQPRRTAPPAPRHAMMPMRRLEPGPVPGAIPALPRPAPAAPMAAGYAPPRPAVPPAPPVAQPAATPVVAPAVVRPFPRASQRSCCWPMGEPGTADFRFCGAEAMPTKPYCAEHAAIAYVKVRDRREDAA